MSKNKVTLYRIDGYYEEDDNQEFYFEGIKIIIQRCDGSCRKYLRRRTNWWACYFQVLNELSKLEDRLFTAPPSEEVRDEEEYSEFPALYKIYDEETGEVWYVVGKNSDDAISKLPQCVSRNNLDWEAIDEEWQASWWIYTIQEVDDRWRSDRPYPVLASSWEMAQDVALYLRKTRWYDVATSRPICG